MAELQTPGGLQGVHLLPADVVFDWLFDDNRDLAKAMGACGANVYLHGLAGYQVHLTEAQVPVVSGLPPTFDTITSHPSECSKAHYLTSE